MPLHTPQQLLATGFPYSRSTKLNSISFMYAVEKDLNNELLYATQILHRRVEKIKATLNYYISSHQTDENASHLTYEGEELRAALNSLPFGKIAVIEAYKIVLTQLKTDIVNTEKERNEFLVNLQKIDISAYLYHKVENDAEISEMKLVQQNMKARFEELEDTELRMNQFHSLLEKIQLLQRKYKIYDKGNKKKRGSKLPNKELAVAPSTEESFFNDILFIANQNSSNHAGISLDRATEKDFLKRLRGLNSAILSQKISEIPARETQERVARLLGYLQENPQPSR